MYPVAMPIPVKCKIHTKYKTQVPIKKFESILEYNSL